MKNELITLGQNIRRCRKEQKVSQEILARACGLQRTYLCDVERGTRNITFLTLMKLTAGLKSNIAELTKGVDPATLVQVPASALLHSLSGQLASPMSLMAPAQTQAAAARSSV